MNPREVRETIALDAESEAFLRTVIAKLNLSARVYDRILKVARTIADLRGEPNVKKAHLAEAVQFRERSEF
jgi:magnesium chelatase family protein